jgi:hypothetical protein
MSGGWQVFALLMHRVQKRLTLGNLGKKMGVYLEMI